MVSPRNYFLYTPLLPAVATGTMEERSIVEPVRNLVQKKASGRGCGVMCQQGGRGSAFAGSLRMQACRHACMRVLLAACVHMAVGLPCMRCFGRAAGKGAKAGESWRAAGWS